MLSLSEIRKYSFRSLQKNEAQKWKRNANEEDLFHKTASMPQLKYVLTDDNQVKDSVPVYDARFYDQKLGDKNDEDTSPDITMLQIDANRESCDFLQGSSSTSDMTSDIISEDQDDLSYQKIAFGFQTLHTYEHRKKQSGVIDVLYNGRTRRFLLLDSRGISSWAPSDSSGAEAVKRELKFPKYQTKLLRSVLFCRKYNVYFAVCKDFTLQVYNKNFHETHKTVNKNQRSILHIVFNSQTDELITSGVAGTTVWKYRQMDRNVFDNIKPMANYELVIDAEYPDIGGTWCTKIELISSVQFLFYCSEIDLFAYDARDMRRLFCINGAHAAALTCVGFSVANRVVLTGSLDCEVKVWGASGGHVCTLRGHSRPVCSLVLHPDIPGLVFTASLDGTVKVWSLHTMDLFCSLSLDSEGIRWMNLTDDGLLWCCNSKLISLLRFNPVANFWGHARCHINNLEMVEHPDKTKRLMAVGDDGSVRLFSKSKSDDCALCTVLPPPVVSLLDSIRDVTHSRFNHLFFILINPLKIWVYTAKTDPACRIAEWNVSDILKGLGSTEKILPISSTTSLSNTSIRNFEEKKSLHRCTQILTGKTGMSECCSLLAAYSENGFQFHSPDGLCSAKSRHLLLLGLEDGRIVFADQKQRGMLYCELQANKEPITSLKHKSHQNWLITQCLNTHHVIIQIWKLPELELLNTTNCSIAMTAYTLMNNTLITGYSTGHVRIQNLTSTGASKQPEAWIENVVRHPEHKAPVIDVKSCLNKEVFCSCSSDGVIRVWDVNKVLLSDIQLDAQLSCCNFLNDLGDLVVGWKNHIFLVDHKTLQLREDLEEKSESSEKESAIYEDPAIRYESDFKIRAKTSKITMHKYLVPYGFVNTENVEDMDLVLLDNEKPESEESENSEKSICALTETYLSPAQSIVSFGVIDAIFPPKSQAIDQQSRRDDLMLPEFGVSPLSSVSSVSIRSFQEDEGYSDGEVFDELYEEEEYASEAEEDFTPATIEILEEMKEEGTVTDKPIKSRFANMKLDSKKLMKKGVNVVIAAEAFKARRKSSEGGQDGRSTPTRPAKRIITKRRRSQTPNEIQIPAQEKGSGDIPISEEHEAQEPAPLMQIGGIDMGMKIQMSPHTKVDSIPSKQTPYRRSSAMTMFQKQKQAIIKRPSKASIHANKQKLRSSKSGSLRRRKSTDEKNVDLLLLTGNKLNAETQSTKEKLLNLDLPTASSPTNQGFENKNSGAPVTHVQMVYKRPEIFTDKQGNISTKKPNSMSESNRDNADSGFFMGNRVTKDSDDETVTSSARTPKSVLGYEQVKKSGIEGEKNSKLSDEEEIFNSQNKNKANSEIEKDSKWISDDIRSLGEEDSGDDDEIHFPNLLDYDFHAIYKKDGLQFDETWQDRMLERYMLMKMQKKQRQEAAMNKRIYLEQERQFRLLSARPELLQKFTEPWMEDPDILANYILNSALMRGESNLNSPYMGYHSNDRPNSQMHGRPSSSASSIHLFARNSENLSDNDTHFRFSIRPKSCGNIQDAHAFQRKSSTPLPPTPMNSCTTVASKGCNSSKRLTLERPRSSTSIPGKTRYILVKPELVMQTSDKALNPSKLEEQLLRKRFPSQHQSMLKSLGRLDEIEQAVECRSIFNKGNSEQQYFHNYRRGSRDMIQQHTTGSAPSSAHHRALRRSYKSETDAPSSNRKDSYNASLSRQSEVLLLHKKSNDSCNSQSTLHTINPLDIVKRSSFTPKASTRKTSVKSVPV